jgi:hypothetical protein
MPLRPFLAALLVAAALASPQARAEWREVPYADVAKMSLDLKKSDPQGVFTTYYILKPAKGRKAPPADVQFRVRAGDQVIDVPVGPGGRVQFPLHPEWVEQGAVVLVNQPKGSFQMSFGLDPRTPPGTRMTYAALAESAPILERGIKDYAGMFSLFAPKVRGLLLDFEPGTPQTVDITLPDGKRRTFKADAKGRVRLPWEPDWAGAAVVLSAPLKKFDLELK